MNFLAQIYLSGVLASFLMWLVCAYSSWKDGCDICIGDFLAGIFLAAISWVTLFLVITEWLDDNTMKVIIKGKKQEKISEIYSKEKKNDNIDYKALLYSLFNKEDDADSTLFKLRKIERELDEQTKDIHSSSV